jgi:hypothetical protein
MLNGTVHKVESLPGKGVCLTGKFDVDLLGEEMKENSRTY